MTTYRLTDTKSSNPIKDLRNNKSNPQSSSLFQKIYNSLEIKQLPTNFQYGPLSQPLIIDTGSDIPFSTTLVFPQPNLENKIIASGSPVFGLTKSSINLINGGSGHFIGDTYKISSSSSSMSAILSVTQVDENGAILDYRIWYTGYNFNNSNIIFSYEGNISLFDADNKPSEQAVFSFVPDKFCIVDIKMINGGSGYQWQNENGGPKRYLITCSDSSSMFLATAIVGPSFSTYYDSNFVQNTDKISSLENHIYSTQNPLIIDKLDNSILSVQSLSGSSSTSSSSDSYSTSTSSSSVDSISSSSSSTSSNCTNIENNKNPNTGSFIVTISTASLGTLLPFSSLEYYTMLSTINTTSEGLSGSYHQGRAVGQALDAIREAATIFRQVDSLFRKEIKKLGLTPINNPALYKEISDKYQKLFEKRFNEFIIKSKNKYKLLWQVIANSQFEQVVFNLYKLNNRLFSGLVKEKDFLALWNKMLVRIRKEQIRRTLINKNIFLFDDTKANKELGKKVIAKIGSVLFKNRQPDVPPISSFEDCIKKYPPRRLTVNKTTIGIFLALIILSSSESEAAIQVANIISLVPDPFSIGIETFYGTYLGSDDEFRDPVPHDLALLEIYSYLLDYTDDAYLLYLFQNSNIFGYSDNPPAPNAFDFNQLFGITSTDPNEIMQQLKQIKTNLLESNVTQEIKKRNLNKQFIELLSFLYQNDDQDPCGFSDVNILSLEELLNNLQESYNEEFDRKFLPNYTPEQIEQLRKWLDGECSKNVYCDTENNSNDGSLNIPIEINLSEDILQELLDKYDSKVPIPRSRQQFDNCIY